MALVRETVLKAEKRQAGTELKDKIFKAAQRLFVEKGYHSTSIPDIVKEAGVSTGAIYHHYSSKEELAREIHKTAVQQFLANFNEQVRTQKSTYAKIRAYTSLMFRWTEQDPVMVQYLLYGRPKEILVRNLTVCSEEGLQATREMVEQGMEAGEIKTMNPCLASAIISGTLMRMIELRLDGLIEHPLEEFIEAAANNIWLALKA
ncbi:TetR/AcrR family transcriptional regulator [Thermincola ferriacetica]|uniref:TetR/AcrR family transcriptional regulator n=1 Tax=Thermincola TaxID=278993 RepID=UPI0002F1FFF3